MQENGHPRGVLGRRQCQNDLAIGEPAIAHHERAGHTMPQCSSLIFTRIFRGMWGRSTRSSVVTPPPPWPCVTVVCQATWPLVFGHGGVPYGIEYLGADCFPMPCVDGFRCKKRFFFVRAPLSLHFVEGQRMVMVVRPNALGIFSGSLLRLLTSWRIIEKRGIRRPHRRFSGQQWRDSKARRL